MNRRRKFTLEVQGSGQLLSMFCTEAKAYFPNATVFDRSHNTNDARRREAGLGQSPASARLRENLARPTPSDVTVNFSGLGTTEEVVVKTVQGKERLRHDLMGSSMRDAERFVDNVLRTIRAAG
ncbi:hypothetical protein [Panacagrimonas sp.]|uniref:hypothetical protein n=1 Tax=Panacagrimonas sp. TaxID=2480088 RepID=UPI003B529D45